MTPDSLSRQDTEALEAIREHAQHILAHRDDPCELWEGHGCEVAMVHEAEDILKLVDGLLKDPR